MLIQDETANEAAASCDQTVNKVENLESSLQRVKHIRKLMKKRKNIKVTKKSDPLIKRF